MQQKLKIMSGIISFDSLFTLKQGRWIQMGYYVDKTRFLEPVYNDGAYVTLYTRPRRFGKSLFLSMMNSFFSPNTIDPSDISKHQQIFSNFDIYKDQSFCNEHMGQHPVLHITFASCGSSKSKEMSLRGLANAVSLCAKNYKFLLDSNALSKYDKDDFNDFVHFYNLDLNNSSVESKLEMSLSLLCDMLFAHFGHKVIVLIDEYDTPLAKASTTDYYYDFKETYASMLEKLLKINTHVEKAIVTGCLRVAKESIFTGLNNFLAIDYDNPTYSSVFGFTTDEVNTLLSQFNLQEHFETYKSWYDGYYFGKDEIYCPWDVINYTHQLLGKESTKPIAYWNHSSSNDLAMLAFSNDPDAYVAGFEKLLKGQSVVVPYYIDMNYKIIENNDTPQNPYLWSILYMTGYLTKDKDQVGCNDNEIKVRIPNRCVYQCLKDQIDKSFSAANPVYVKKASDIAKCFKDDNAAILELKINQALNAYVSVYDIQKGTDKESLYHAFLNGTLSAVLNVPNDSYASNLEIGNGRADILFLTDLENNPKNKKCVIIECKVANSEKDLDSKAIAAVKQVKDKYLKGVVDKYRAATKVAIYGIAFYKKECRVNLEIVIV